MIYVKCGYRCDPQTHPDWADIEWNTRQESV